MSSVPATEKQKKIGRPSVDSEAVNVTFQRDKLVELDGWRREQFDIPARPEAIRRLMDESLARWLSRRKA